LEELRTLGCDYVQGYFISKPLSACDVAVWLELERRF
jgi:EAL domain-containing protein (putative c-di-GMP-specific phosphodiesterase class I)